MDLMRFAYAGSHSLLRIDLSSPPYVSSAILDFPRMSRCDASCAAGVFEEGSRFGGARFFNGCLPVLEGSFVLVDGAILSREDAGRGARFVHNSKWERVGVCRPIGSTALNTTVHAIEAVNKDVFDRKSFIDCFSKLFFQSSHRGTHKGRLRAERARRFMNSNLYESVPLSFD